LGRGGIKRLVTDNAWAYKSSTWERQVASINACHKRTPAAPTSDQRL